MKHGTIVRNLWQPSHESLLVYTGISGKYAKCLWVIDGVFHGMHDFYKADILNDREHFPIVGFINIADAIKAGLFHASKEQ